MESGENFTNIVITTLPVGAFIFLKLPIIKRLFFSVNSICWAPVEYGLLLACGSSDGSVSILSSAAGKLFLLLYFLLGS